MADEKDIQLGKLIGSVDALQAIVTSMSCRIDRLSSDVTEIKGFVNRSKGAIGSLLALAGALGGAVGWVVTLFRGE